MEFDEHRQRADPLAVARSAAAEGAARDAPSRHGRRLNLLYGTQVRTRPPRFRFFVNDPGLVTRDYGYWVENKVRERFALEGIPVAIDFVRRG